MKTAVLAKRAFMAAFPRTIPIMTGFLFLGAAYGIYARGAGLPAAVPIAMATIVFAGSMEFVAVDMMTAGAVFDPLGALLMAIMVNARHLFYGISMLDKYKNTGKKKWYLVFGLCDESFSINCTADVPDDVDSGWFYFFVTLLNQIYWLTGTALGTLAGTFFTVEGLDFVMTALLTVLFVDNLLKEKSHIGSVIGVCAALLCLLIFSGDSFIIPAMLLILLALTIFRKPIERKLSP
ncbi:MAG: AzlC family ABC transporter permease [Oscillospiraceae bacterium]|nr:AzlC family ABC transporter permease [Oscillospiraceae bacterium]